MRNHTLEDRVASWIFCVIVSCYTLLYFHQWDDVGQNFSVSFSQPLLSLQIPSVTMQWVRSLDWVLLQEGLDKVSKWERLSVVKEQAIFSARQPVSALYVFSKSLASKSTTHFCCTSSFMISWHMWLDTATILLVFWLRRRTLSIINFFTGTTWSTLKSARRRVFALWWIFALSSFVSWRLWLLRTTTFADIHGMQEWKCGCCPRAARLSLACWRRRNRVLRVWLVQSVELLRLCLKFLSSCSC